MAKLLLQYKILLGYVLLFVIIGCMAVVLFHERNRIQEIESETNVMRVVRRDINNIHRHVTDLALSGESVIAWELEDYDFYHTDRLKVDSLLQDLKLNHEVFVLPEQIDSLRYLLEDKEVHLFNIMQAYHRQEVADSLLLHRLPIETKRLTRTRTITKKKKGIAGFFGKKETVQIPPSADAIRSLNEQLITIQEERIRNVDANTDSLRAYNKELNNKLHSLINVLDSHTQKAFQHKEEQIGESHNRSTRIITGLIMTAFFLLIAFYIVIQHELKRDAGLRDKMRGMIDKNNELLDTRKNIILTISHDIRGPLSNINGSAELALDSQNEERRNYYLKNIRIVCKHVLHLLNNLLDVYRLNESKETCNNVTFCLNDLLERIVTGFSYVVSSKGILFRQNFKNTDVVLWGDMDRISQIIDNLLTNALKFTDTGTILFNAGYENERLYLEVKDTGIGMDEDTISRIFRPFERLSSEANAEGFGLGLPITKGLVKLLGGTIDVKSEVGHGSTFYISLPLPVSNEEVESETSALQCPSSLPQRVLVIDNDPLQLEIVKEMLERNGISCTVCTNVKDFVDEFRKQNYDLLLTDIQMPKTNGFEVVTLLRNSKIGNSQTIPIVAMTARGDNEKEAFASNGFTDCIYKPFSMNELLNIVSSVVQDKIDDETVSPNFAAFTADVRDKRKLIRTFISQSKQDIKDLEAAIETGDIGIFQDIAHRIKPTLELLQSDEQLRNFRTTLKNPASDKDTVNRQTRQLIEHLSILVEEAENEIKRMNDEEENTDS